MDKAKRLAIANEVVSMLQSGKLTAKPGCWLDFPSAPDLFTDEDVAAKVPFFEQLGKFDTCYACVQGALFVSAVRNFGGVTCDQVKDCFALNFLTSDEIRPVVLQYFDEHQVALMETAFEGWAEYGVDNSNGLVAAKAFFNLYADPCERMAAIMTNVTKNDGTFKL